MLCLHLLNCAYKPHATAACICINLSSTTRQEDCDQQLDVRTVQVTRLNLPNQPQLDSHLLAGCLWAPCLQSACCHQTQPPVQRQYAPVPHGGCAAPAHQHHQAYITLTVATVNGPVNVKLSMPQADSGSWGKANRASRPANHSQQCDPNACACRHGVYGVPIHIII